MGRKLLIYISFLISTLTQISYQQQRPFVEFQKDMATILIYGDGSFEDLERNIIYTMNQALVYHEVFVAVKSQKLLDQVNSKFNNQDNIKFIKTQDVDDFGKILQGLFHQINGEYIVMIHSKTQISDLEIVNDAGEPWDNSYLIDLDYNRNLDLILFSMDFRFEASLLLRKRFLAQILNQFSEISRYYIIQSFNLRCDEQTLCLVGYLMIDMYLNKSLFNTLQTLKLDCLQHIEQIYNHLSKLEKARQNSTENPFASIIMSCFNRDYYLLRSIQHVFQQTYVNWELLISDDGSNNPKTLQILQLVSNHPRIRVLYLYTNQYAVFALNYAITQAKGEYLAIQDDDDIMLSTRLNYQIDFLRRNPDYELCGAPLLPLSQIGKPYYYADNYVGNFAKLKFYFLFVNHIPHSNFAIRLTDKIRKHYLYNHQTAYDYSLWLKLLFEVDENIRFAVLPNFVTGIRFHDLRMTNEGQEAQHYSKWVPLKYIEIAEKLHPEIFENMSQQCFLEIFYSLQYNSGTIQSCQGYEIHSYLSQINNGLRNEKFINQNDFKDLDKLFDYYHKQYTWFAQQNKITYQYQKRTFDCIVHHGDIQILLLHIDQLKDYVDYFLVIYFLTSNEEVTMESLQKHSLIKDYESKIEIKFINISAQQLEEYRQEISNLIGYTFVNLLFKKGCFYHEDIIFSKSNEIINPYQLRRYQKLNTNIGFFQLRQYSALGQGEDWKYIRIMSYRLFEKLGYRKAREFVIDQDIFKNLDQPVFEDKLQTIYVIDEYLNVHTMQDAGLYFDDFECRSYLKDNNRSKIYNYIANMSFAEKRKLESFSLQIQDDLISHCGDKNLEKVIIIYDRSKAEL
ncbi:UNKNOWN [Stylonychia lemnae]|uniref:Glycosyltransferase 2-like domain-containing protein n=1 Tax=Stylonychia lemnae TaxID=5949 RepID=A0A078AUS5_STYLE|nr:UNKNOWN [Stylonychia lemnae]|eukprot:CDW85939.1 UNKNOWN [Stylonychia lemnae]